MQGNTKTVHIYIAVYMCKKVIIIVDYVINLTRFPLFANSLKRNKNKELLDIER